MTWADDCWCYHLCYCSLMTGRPAAKPSAVVPASQRTAATAGGAKNDARVAELDTQVRNITWQWLPVCFLSD